MKRKVYVVVGFRAMANYERQIGACGIFKTLNEARNYILQEMDKVVNECDPNFLFADKETFTIEYANIVHAWEISPIYADI